MSVNVKIPSNNPVRFRPTTGAIDYINKYPRLDLMTQRTEYYKGVVPVSVYQDMRASRTIYFQMQINSTSPSIIARLVNAQTGALTAIVWNPLTVQGWVGYPVYFFYVNPTVSGYYYMTVNIGALSENYISDTFYVNSDTPTEKNLISIEYRNSYNKHGIVWETSLIYWNYFVTGLYRFGNAQTENSVSEEDDGVNIYNSTSYAGRILQLCDVHETQLRQLEKIFTLDTLKVNGEIVVCKSGIETTNIESTDLYDVTVNLTLKNMDEFLNFD